MYLTALNAELNPICHLLALLGAHHILHVSGVRVKHHPALPSPQKRKKLKYFDTTVEEMELNK